MSDSSIITAITPIHIGIIKYYTDPDVKSFYPTSDYLTATLDPSAKCAKVSVCARREFTDNEFWLNGEKNAPQLAFWLNEVKYLAATQRSVSMEFLTRKVHIACENNFLPSPGTPSFAAGFISVMVALFKLYKIRTKSVKNHFMYADLMNAHCGGFMQKRDLNAKKNFKSKVIAQGKDWPDLRVLVLVVKRIRNQNPTEATKASVTPSENMKCRLAETLPVHLKAITKAIKDKDFATFAETSMRDNNQYHSTNAERHPDRASKTKISDIIIEVIRIYNKTVGEVRAGYIFDTGPNAALFFLKKHAQEVISLIKHVFPTTNPYFLRGLQDHTDLNPEYFRQFPIAPMKCNLIKFAVYSKIGNISVQLDKGHLLDENGDLITATTESSPSKGSTSSSSENSDAFGGSQDDIN